MSSDIIQNFWKMEDLLFHTHSLNFSGSCMDYVQVVLECEWKLFMCVSGNSWNGLS